MLGQENDIRVACYIANISNAQHTNSNQRPVGRKWLCYTKYNILLVATRDVVHSISACGPFTKIMAFIIIGTTTIHEQHVIAFSNQKAKNALKIVAKISEA
jgi:hypothetical protein